MADLMIHGRNRRVDRDTLALVPTPEPTETHRPVSHAELVDGLLSTVGDVGFTVRDEQYRLNPSGTKLFGILKFNESRSGDDGMTWSLGFRNSHDKSMSVGLTAGVNVLVCDNMCFGGERTLSRRHTSGFRLDAMLREGLASLMSVFRGLGNNIDRLKERSMSLDQVRVFVIRAAEAGAINGSDILPVLREYEQGGHEVFGGANAWRLNNAFTEVVKKYTPARFDKAQRRLAPLFGLDGSPRDAGRAAVFE
jgi:hypothetical protein